MSDVSKKPDKKVIDKAAIKRICITAMCIGLGALCKLFSLNIALFGGSGMKIGLAGIFTTLPALLYGPMYGGAASAASDIIGCIIAPTGPYNPLYTLTAFAGGYVKGLVWKLLCRFDKKKLRVIAAACFAVFLALGVMFYAFLASDGISGGVFDPFASADEMPEKGEVASYELSFVSRLITDRVRTTDTFTVKSAPDAENIELPGKVTYVGANVTVAVGKGAFAGCAKLKSVYVPDTVKSVSYDETLADVTFYVSESAKSYASLKEAGAKILPPESVTELSVDLAKGVFVSDGFEFSTHDSYRTNLAMYVNFATFALTLVGLLGLLLTAAEYAFSRLRKGEPTYALRVFAAIFTCEMLVTTLNTVILKEMTFASTWANYPFIVVWIPRAIEGVFICVIQAYAITALLKAMRKIPGISLEPPAKQKSAAGLIEADKTEKDAHE